MNKKTEKNTLQQNKRNEYKHSLKHRLMTALMIAPTLSVMLLSVIYNNLVGGQNVVASQEFPILASVVTVLSIVASAVLLYIYERKLPLIFLSAILSLCFIVYAILSIGGVTNADGEGFFGMMAMIFLIPTQAFIPLASAISTNYTAIMLLILAALSAVNILFAVKLTMAEKKGGRK